jgi:flagellar biosynthesis/type III secretory pathway protein FliH
MDYRQWRFEMRPLLFALIVVLVLLTLPACDSLSDNSPANSSYTQEELDQAYERGFSEGKAAVYSIGYTEGKDEGEKIGYEKGYGNCQHRIDEVRPKFYNEGYEAGLRALSDSDIHNLGYREGYDEGYDDGYHDGRLGIEKQN